MSPVKRTRPLALALSIKSTNVLKIIDYCRILFIRADSNYSMVYIDDQTFIMTSKTLFTIESDLDNETFFRCHRGYLVNVLQIREISTKEGLHIVLKGGHKVPLARRRVHELRKLLCG